MIVVTGKIIRVELVGGLKLECTSEAPGRITLTRDGVTVGLPGNPEEAERLIAAYRRVLAEDLGYRKMEVE